MPYDRNADLPEAVRDALPTAAQSIFRAAFNAALKTYKGDESKAAAVAWSAVKKAGYSKSASGKWSLSESGVDAMASNKERLFVNALEPRAVTSEKTADGKWRVKGLPLIHPGEWNGHTYTADDMQEIATNFDRLRDDDGFTPGLWPRHNYDHDGNNLPQDANNALGFYERMYVDGESGAVLGDVDVFDEQTARDMEAGKLRYISGEVLRDSKHGLKAIGAAFVPSPAVSGLPWHLVINAADYSDATTSSIEKPEGGNSMPKTWKDKLFGLFTAVAEEDPEVFSEALADLETEASEEEADTEGEADELDEEQEDDPMEVESLTRQLTQKNSANVEMQKQMAVLRQEMSTVTTSRQHDLAEAKLDQWVAAGYVSPVARDYVMPLAQYALAAPEKVTILAEDGGKIKRPMIDVLEEALKLTSPAEVKQGASGSMVWTGSEDLDAEDKDAMVAQGEAMAALVNSPPNDG